MKYKRSDRVSALLLRELARMVEEGLKNPDIGFVTLTAVELSDDLKHAKVFVALRGDEAAQERTMRALDKSLPHAAGARETSAPLRRPSPSSVDRSFDYAERINRLLDRIP
jgi:ribosome-binding factor A